jgi:hypothetical protein
MKKFLKHIILITVLWKNINAAEQIADVPSTIAPSTENVRGLAPTSCFDVAHVIEGICEFLDLSEIRSFAAVTHKTRRAAFNYITRSVNNAGIELVPESLQRASRAVNFPYLDVFHFGGPYCLMVNEKPLKESFLTHEVFLIGEILTQLNKGKYGGGPANILIYLGILVGLKIKNDAGCHNMALRILDQLEEIKRSPEISLPSDNWNPQINASRYFIANILLQMFSSRNIMEYHPTISSFSRNSTVKEEDITTVIEDCKNCCVQKREEAIAYHIIVSSLRSN